MTKFREEFRIKSTRLKEWDYSNPWWYYVTINTKDHVEYLGIIKGEKVLLNDLGKAAEKFWQEITAHFKNVDLDCFVIMPNHIHGIVIMRETVETRHASSLHHKHFIILESILNRIL